MTDLAALIERNDLAGIMRLILALLDDLYPDAPGAAYRQNVNLRGHIQQLYNSQNFIPDGPEPIRIAAIAAACHNFLRDGKSINTIMLIPVPDLLASASNLEQKFRAYNCGNMPSSDIRQQKCSKSYPGGVNIPTSKSDTHITGNADGKSERVGDADQPAPSGGYVRCEGLAHLAPDGYPLYYLPEHIQEQIKADAQKPKGETVTVHIGPISINPDAHQKLQDEIARFGGTGSRRFSPPADGSSMTLELFREAAAYNPKSESHELRAAKESMYAVIRKSLREKSLYEEVMSGVALPPEHENAFTKWIVLRLHAMLAFQTIKGWYKPKDGVK